MRFKYLHLLLQPGHLQDLPLRGRCGNAPHRPLLLRRLSALRTPVMPAAVDQVLGYQDLRAVQVQFHHALKDQTVQQVGEAGHVGDGAAQDSLFGHLPRGGHHLRRVVPLRPHRTDHRGGPGGFPGVALLDQADCGGHRVHGGPGVHVRAVQDVRTTVQEVACLQ